jgi:UDP-N-acetylmuramoyl-tripeptide--D-alanyl-D-alanine ligase
VKTTFESGGKLLSSNLAGHDDEPWFGATIDTRAECAHRIFFALRGERTDGHRFVEDAHSKGCAAVVVEGERAAASLLRLGAPYFRVSSALDALQELARAYRQSLGVRVIAVTGSMGKTTAKEYIRAILKKKYAVHSNPGNLNNHIGVPLTVLDTDHDNEYLVCEIAANHPGEIELLSRLLEPDIGVITNIGDAHIGHFGSRAKIAEAKAEIFLGIDPEGYAVLPADDEFMDALRERAHCRVVTFGRAESSAYRITDVSDADGKIRFEINGAPMEIETVAAFNVSNAAAAYAVGELCGVEGDRIREALSECGPMAGRWKVYRGREVVLVDDSYNANPTSMRAALESFCRLAAKRRIAVLGDMAELGSFTGDAHRDLGAFIRKRPIDAVHWLGKNGDLVEEGLRGGKPKLRSHALIADLAAELERELRAGDVVLVKASRACHLDELVGRLLDSVLHLAKN